MQNTSLPASLLSITLSNEKKSVVNAHSISHFQETDKNHFSRLYSLFFGGSTQHNRQPDLQQVFTEPDEYSSYE